MSKWELIKNLKFKQLYALLGWFFKHPLFMWATFKATLKTLQIAESKFPNTHGLHGKGNAFRHAIWNLFIAQECYRFQKNEAKVLTWTKQITDWHEEFSPNENLPKLMDLHNNKIGRNYFKELKNESKIKSADFLYLVSKNALKIRQPLDIKGVNNLVFLEEE